MATSNPLFPSDNQNSGASDSDPAVELIRAKLKRIYGDEPNAATELAEAEIAPTRELSKHQKFMLELQDSGKPLAQIQTDWHNYYLSLPDNEKHQVWQEFYAAQASVVTHPFVAKPAASNPSSAASDGTSQAVVSQTFSSPEPKPIARRARRARPGRQSAAKKSAEIKAQIRNKVAARQQFEKRNMRARHNLQSLAFGLATGFVVLLIFMFSFFNQRFIAPFVQPGSASAAPIILDTSVVAPTKQPEIIIPKINVEIPLVGFDLHTTDESQVEGALEDGVVHYPTTVLPGQLGNSAFFGHSSNNIFNPGKYKFAFALLHKLNKGDIFYITYNQKIYAYKVYDKQVVSPANVGVLNNVPGKAATATLITCTPVGTSLNRLVVWGEQISPSPSSNNQTSAAVTSQPNGPPKAIVGNGPSLLSRIWPF